MERGRGVRRAVTGLLALAVVASLRVGGGGVAAGPGFATTTLVNPAFKGANTEPSLRFARDGTALGSATLPGPTSG